VVLVLPRGSVAGVDISTVVGQGISFFLIGLIFGYPSQLLQKLHQTHAELAAKNLQLARRNRDLHLMQELSLVMQSSLDPAELQESILRGLVRDLDYKRAMISLYDEQQDSLSGWLILAGSTENGQPAEIGHTEVISLRNDQGPLARALKGKFVVEITGGDPPTSSPAMPRTSGRASPGRRPTDSRGS